MHECICFILHTYIHSHSHSFTFAAFMLPFTLLCPNKKLPSTRPKRNTQKIEREKRHSVAFLRLHSRDDGSVKWLLATRRRQATLILRVLFVNVAVDVALDTAPVSLMLSLYISLHRICCYCYQLSKAPHTHTHTQQTRALHHLCYPSSPSHTSSLRAIRLRLALALASAVEWQKLFTYRFASHGQVTYASVPGCVCVSVCVCFSISSLSSHSAPFSYALHLGSFVLFWYSCVCGVKWVCDMWHAVCGMRRVACESAVAIGTPQNGLLGVFFG